MRLRGDTRGEIGVFEDLQTLIVVVVGIAILLASTMYNWSAFGTAEQDQELYDEAERLIDAVESYDRIRAINNFGSIYPEFLLRQADLEILTKGSQFEDDIKSDFNYNITFDDLVIPDSAYDPGNDTRDAVISVYEFGKNDTGAKGTVVAKVQYALVFEEEIGIQEYDVSERHACIMTVVVWR